MLLIKYYILIMTNALFMGDLLEIDEEIYKKEQIDDIESQEKPINLERFPVIIVKYNDLKKIYAIIKKHISVGTRIYVYYLERLLMECVRNISFDKLFLIFNGLLYDHYSMEKYSNDIIILTRKDTKRQDLESIKKIVKRKDVSADAYEELYRYIVDTLIQMEKKGISIEELKEPLLTISSNKILNIACERVLKNRLEMLPINKKITAEMVNQRLSPIFLGGLRNSNNSCFMDSVLVPLFLVSDIFVNIIKTKKIIESDDASKTVNYDVINKDIIAIMNNVLTMKKTTYCSNFKNSISKYSNAWEILVSGEQQDDAEFLAAFLHLYNSPTIIPFIISRSFSNDKINWVEQRATTDKANILHIFGIPKGQHNITKVYEMESFTDYSHVIDKIEFKNVKYNYMKEKFKIDGTPPVIIYHANRRFLTFKNILPIRFNEFIKKENTIYELRSITIHTGSYLGGHYTAFFKVDGFWYYYDDIAQPSITLINIKNHEKVIETTGSLFFYYKI